MPTTATPQTTDFSIDVLGRYICNGLDEALASTDRNTHPDARPFDTIVIGAGTYGAVGACAMFFNDTSHAHRVLILDAGSFVLPEHVQNLPPLINPGEVWGVPWSSDSPQPWNQRFPGLAYCLGGRSLFWGGWAPYLIDTELDPAQWPADVRRDLMSPVLPPEAPVRSYQDEAAEQIGTASTNDFVSGPLHDALRQRLFEGLRARPTDGPTALVGHRGTPMTAALPTEQLIADLEGPLAVLSQSPRPGFFPFNKFNGAQLLIRAARLAQTEAERSTVGGTGEQNVKKRLMIVDRVHIISLERDGSRITRIHTNLGPIDVPPHGRVVLSTGTVESTRLALASLPNARGLIGRNLMAHLRSNVTVRIPRTAVLGLEGLDQLSVSALIVKGVHRYADGRLGHFHVQATATGVDSLNMDAEAELFKKIPDVDTLDQFATLDDEWIVVALRGIGEMTGDKTSADPLNRIRLDVDGPRGDFDFGQPRALVRLEADDPADPARRNLELWDAMDAATDEVARLLAGAGSLQYLVDGAWQDAVPSAQIRRDPLSSTHHESGTCWMGTDPETSVTDPSGRFHESDNLYAIGTAVLPTCGSPNPMLIGVALARRTADLVVAEPRPEPPEPGFTYLFDGTERTYRHWAAVGGGAFALVDGAIHTQPGAELGLLYYGHQGFDDFVLRLQVRVDNSGDNGGVFVRSRDPRQLVPDRVDPTLRHSYGNKSYVAIDTGFEIQVDDLARPGGEDRHRTGAIYDIPIGGAPGQQQYQRPTPLVPGQWTDLQVTVRGNTYQVVLNGAPTTSFTNVDAFRGRPVSEDPASGFAGLQCHTGRVSYRQIRINRLARI